MLLVRSYGDSHVKEVSNNIARSGGGVAIGIASASNNFRETVISGNTAVFSAGGVLMGFAAPANFNRCTLSNNIAIYGGGITGDDITMTNSTISKNTATSRGSVIFHTTNFIDNYSKHHCRQRWKCCAALGRNLHTLDHV